MGVGARELAAVCGGLADVPPGVMVTDISLDSRRVAAGGLFLACAGRRTHGLAALPEALARGARAVFWEPAPGIAPPTVPPGVFAACIDGLSHRASAIAGNFFDSPSASLQVAGITGTNGKTTTAWLLAQALGHCGSRAAYIGTLGAGTVPDGVVPGEYTTGDAVSVQRQLAALRDDGARCVAMEVSSHALDQSRVAAVRFQVAGFSNLTRDHLDYHGTMEAYAAAKARLFQMPRLEVCVLNVDDACGAELARRHGPHLPLVLAARTAQGMLVIEDCRARGFAVQALTASGVRSLPDGIGFMLEAGTSDAASARQTVVLPLIGEFNVDNALLALGLLIALGIPLEAALEALMGTGAPPGRMEAITATGRPLAIVDYAHTPDALAKALRAARAHCRGRLHVVFGCGGDRDAGKRSLMAGVAGAMADAVVITDDNPRSESATGIVADILAGLPAGVRATVIHERGAAILHALETAGEADVVLVAGKGHEDYQILGGERRAFSDREFIRSVYHGALSPQPVSPPARVH
jgi:UDP-N-acetylmuramoyl-L-alanyl-D-glutamate--2,6-diaminopimelate ligase